MQALLLVRLCISTVNSSCHKVSFNSVSLQATPCCNAVTPIACAVQVVYILDQVRALEQEMRRRLAEQGLEDIRPGVMVVTRLIPQAMGTTCNERIERIHGTEHAYILRVPFRDSDGRVSRAGGGAECCSGCLVGGVLVLCVSSTRGCVWVAKPSHANQLCVYSARGSGGVYVCVCACGGGGMQVPSVPMLGGEGWGSCADGTLPSSNARHKALH